MQQLITLSNDTHTAQIDTRGARVIAWGRHQQPSVLWGEVTPPEADPITFGGIPICWPWFAWLNGQHDRPIHGFARKLVWHTRDERPDAVALTAHDDEATHALWPHAFALDVTIRLDDALHLDLTIHNTGDAPFTFTGALHSYVAVGDVEQIAIGGLEGCRYLDKVDGGTEHVQNGVIYVRGETDRVYLNTTAPCTLDDPLLARRIVISKTGSHTTVIWNPGAFKSPHIPGFGVDAWRKTICIETAIAGEEVVTLAAGESHRIGMCMQETR